MKLKVLSENTCAQDVQKQAKAGCRRSEGAVLRGRRDEEEQEGPSVRRDVLYLHLRDLQMSNSIHADLACLPLPVRKSYLSVKKTGALFPWGFNPPTLMPAPT